MSAPPAEKLLPEQFQVIRTGTRSLRINRRVAVVTGMLAIACLIASVWSLTIGDTDYSLSQVIGAIFGQGSATDQLIIVEWRLPRTLLGLLGGAALGVSGAIIQSLTRNPLGSPDVIGFASGAYTGALIALLVVGGSSGAASLGALIGGLVTALAVYLLAYQRGVQGMRFIVVGISVAAMLNALNSFLLISVGSDEAVSAASWGAGSLNNATWTGVVTLLISFVFLIPLTALNIRPFQLLELGDDSASALGVPAERTKILMLTAGVGFVCFITALAGPIAFVALAAPQLARRVSGAAGVTLLASAMMGGLLLVISDIIARVIIAPDQLAVGIVTSCLGGTYLLWLLVHESRAS